MPYATNGGVRIYYETVGNGPPLVLHVGFIQALQDWQEFGYVDALRDDYHLILLDPRGQGASDKPHDPAAYAYEKRVADIVAVLDAVGVATAHYWGYSMGGRMGFATAQYAPHRLRSVVIGGDGATTPDKEGYLQWAERLRTGGPEGLVAGWERAFDRLPASLRCRLLASDVEALAANRIHGSTAPNLQEGLSRIALPTFVYCGERDELYTAAQAAAARVPRATFLTLSDMTHFQGLTNSDAILPHVRTFLADVDRSTL